MDRHCSKRRQLDDIDTDSVPDHSEFEAKSPVVSTPKTMSDQPDEVIDHQGHDDLVGTEEKMVTSPDDDDDQVKDEESSVIKEDHDQVIEEEKEDIKEEVQAPITLDSFSQEIDHFLSSFSIPVTPDKKEALSMQEEGEGEGEGEGGEGELILGKEEKELVEKEEEPSDETIEEAEEKEQESDLQEKEKIEEEKEDEEKKKEVKVVSVEIPAYVEKFLELFEEEVSKRHSDVEGKVKWGISPEDDTCFLQALDRVSKMAVTVDGLRSDPILGELVNWVIKAQQRAMSYLEDEFRSLLVDIRSVPKPKQQEEQTTHPQQEEQKQQSVAEETNKPEQVENDLFLGYTDDNVSNMSKIATAMISGGYELECCQVYTVIRRHMFDLSLTETGFEKASMDEIQKMQWDALERDIPYWNKAFRECATSFFFKEKKLADAVFAVTSSSFSFSSSSSIFDNLTRGVVIQLLNFAEAVAMTKRSSEKLFKFLDMYETLRDTVPEMDVLFPDGDLKTEAFYARCRIGEAAICSFCDLENSIKSDASKTPVPGGAVHPLTRYTMNYLKYSCEYKSTLEGVFKDHTKIERADSTSRPHYGNNNNNNNNSEDHQNNNNDSNNNNNNSINREESSSPFANQLIRVMELLDSNLDAKSKLYKDISLSSIFMMNNGRYILQKIKGAKEIHDAMGDTWCRKKSSHLRNYHNTYKRETLSKLLGCLSHEGLQVNNKVVKPVLKERFKGFNAIFDEIHRTQSSWVICDEQMQSELRVSISAVVVPAYRSFHGRFSPCFTPGRQYEKYIKYQPEDIEDLIDELFDGNRASMARRR